jgi:hypothetical protein
LDLFRQIQERISKSKFAAVKALTINKTTDILEFAAMMRVTPTEQKMMRTIS